MRIDLVYDPDTTGIAGLPVVSVNVAEDSHSFDTREGTMLRRGYAALDDGGRFLRRGDHAVGDGACLAFNVAGTSRRRAEVQHWSFAPGSPILLRPEPGNPHDANAVGIWDRTGTIKAGFVPRPLNAQVAASFRGGLPLGGAVLSEYRLHSHSGERTGLQVVVAPASALVLDVRGSRDLTFKMSIDLDAIRAMGPGRFGVPVSDPQRGLSQALHLLVAQPDALGFIAVAAKGSDCAVLFDVQEVDGGRRVQVRALLKLEREPNPAQHAALVQGGWRQLDVSGGSWSIYAAPTEPGALERVAGTALTTIFSVFGAAGVLEIASDVAPDLFARLLSSRGVTLAAGM
jgi:hypothetical protein